MFYRIALPALSRSEQLTYHILTYNPNTGYRLSHTPERNSEQ